MSNLILPERLKTQVVVPFPFINKIPEQILRQISWALATATVNADGPAADQALTQLMMEVDMAGRKINEEQAEKQKAKDEKKAKRKPKAVR